MLVTDQQAQEALELAIEQIEKPYVWGGRGPNEFDCSGLITWVYKQIMGRNEIFKIGNYLIDDATMKDLYAWNVDLLPIYKAKPGDIVFFTNEDEKVTHGGMFIRLIDENTFEFINASSYHGKVIINTWPIDGEKSGQWFIGAGRLKLNI